MSHQTIDMWHHLSTGNNLKLGNCLLAGADSNAISTYMSNSVHGNGSLPVSTPLIAALCKSAARQLETVQLLLEHGADASGYDSLGVSTYCYALGTKNPEIIKIMVSALSNA